MAVQQQQQQQHIANSHNNQETSCDITKTTTTTTKTTSTLQRESRVPWDKVPLVPRPSQVAEPFTVWGRKRIDPRKDVYQYSTLDDVTTIRGKNPAKDDHTRQLIDGGAVEKIGLDAAAELAQRGHVFDKGVLARKPAAKYHAHSTPATGRTRILMALQTPSWYRF